MGSCFPGSASLLCSPVVCKYSLRYLVCKFFILYKKNELLQHCKRVLYVTAVVNRALEANIDNPSPDGHGWRIDRDAGMEIQWMTQKPAPDSIVELVSRNCKISKSSNQSCVCLAYGLKFTDICNCSSCNNEAIEEEYSDDENDSDSEFSD